jgi:GNAT superfamily N-acetyltransferase
MDVGGNNKALDAMITDGFSKALADLQVFCSSLGSLSVLEALFPPKTAPCLRALADVTVGPSLTSRPFFTVTLGVGLNHAEEQNLHEFYNCMLEFETEQSFSNFVKSGYSVVITGGTEPPVVVAAASFVVAAEGIFVDAIAVSHGAHINACSLPTHAMTPAMVKIMKKVNTEDGGSVDLRKALRNKDFQRLGLGSVLLSFLAQCARLRCSNDAAVYLKAHRSTQGYYATRGYKPVADTTLGLPDNLASVVPKSHWEVDVHTILMIHCPPPPDAGTDVEDAAKVMTSLSTSPSAGKRAATSINSSKARKKKRALLQQAMTSSLSAADSAELGSPGEPRLDPGNNFTLPVRDYWEPQTRAYRRFKADDPETSHQLSPKEVLAKYGVHDPRWVRLTLLRKARAFQEDTTFMQTLGNASALRYNESFTDQEYLDLAAVTDPNRDLELHYQTWDRSTNQVTVKVSSFFLPPTMTLERLLAFIPSRNKLKPAVRLVHVSMPWLLHVTRPEIAQWIEESVHGAKVQRLEGSNIGADTVSLAFSGRVERDNRFVPLPQGHVKNVFSPKGSPLSASEASKAKAAVLVQERSSVRHQVGSRLRKTSTDPTMIYYDIQGNATAFLYKRLKDDAKAWGVVFVPPPPKDDAQIVKLKWLPTPLAGKVPKNDGVWHGLFAIRLGTDKSTSVLLECGLLTEWVELQFAPSIRDECKAIALGKQGKRNPKKFLLIPAGDVHATDVDPPPASELLSLVSLKYLQGNNDTCLRDSLASALESMGFVAEGQVVAADATLVGCNLDLVQRAAAVVQRVFQKANLQMKKLYNHACSVSQVSRLDAAWPIVLLIQTSDGCHGSHAVTTWNKRVYDSNSLHPLRWSQKSLDWCSGKNSTCVGFSRAYRICPANYGHSVPQSATSVGMLVQPHGMDSSTLGWITRLPSKKCKGYLVRHSDGATEVISQQEVDSLILPSSTVG